MSLKMDRGVNFSKEAKWTKLYEKTFNITNIRENTNQNFLEILPHTCQDDCYKKNKRQVLGYDYIATTVHSQ